MPSADDVRRIVDDAQKEVNDANVALATARLTDEKASIQDRLPQAETGAENLTQQRDDAKRNFHQLQGSLSAFAGLHQARADIVDE